MRVSTFLIFAALVVAPFGSAARTASVPRIVDGTKTSDFPSVGAVLIHASPTDPTVVSLCSGTLVGCRSFLTAAHCVCPFTSDTADECLRQGVATPEELTVFLQHVGRLPVRSVAIHPAFSFTDGGDVALLALAEPVSIVPPAVLNGAGRIPLGTAATIVGFGNSGGEPFTQNDFGIKRFGAVRTGLCEADIDDTAHVCWEFDGVGSNTCGGDSGGPLFVTDDDRERIAGVTSGGRNRTCLAPDAGFDTDVFVHLDWLLEAIVASEGDEPCPAGPILGSELVAVETYDGVLERSDTTISFPLEVPPATVSLVVTLNGALFSSGSFSTPNEFSLSLQPLGAPLAECIDAALGPFDTCHVDAPEPGPWEIRVGRLRGFGEFQLTATLALAAAACAGDCDGDGVVESDELARVVQSIFDADRLIGCESADTDGDGQVSAADLVRAARNAAAGCATSASSTTPSATRG